MMTIVNNRSVSYNSETETCYISTKTKDSHPDDFQEKFIYNYIEKIDKCLPRKKFYFA